MRLKLTFFQELSWTAIGKLATAADSGRSAVGNNQSPRQCAGCGSVTDQLLQCANCEAAGYCSKECQRRSWEKHKTICRAVRGLTDAQRSVITNMCEVSNRTGKRAAIAKLIGRKTEITCIINGMICDVLWDTGAQVSLVNCNWLRKNMPKCEVRPVSELLEGVEIEGIDHNTIPYSGYTLLEVEVTRGQAVTVPFLVTDMKMRQPLVGTNVMEELVSSYGEAQLSAAFRQQDGVTISAVTAELLTELQPLSLVKTMIANTADRTIKAGQVGVIKCKIKNIEVDMTTPVLFQPMPDWNGEHSGVRVQESVVELKHGINQRIKVTVVNTSDQDFTFDCKEVLGTLEELESVMPVEVRFQPFSKEDIETGAMVASNRAMVAAVLAEDDNLGATSRGQEATTPTAGGSRCDARTFSEIRKEEVELEDEIFHQQLSEMVFTELSPEETESAKTMMWEMKEAFARHPDDIGSAPELTLKLHTTDEVPVQRRYNSIPRPLYADVKKHIQLLLDKKWIEKSNSPWSSPIVCATKKGGGLRLCVDYRLLNKKTISDKHPLPRIQEALDALEGSRIFTTLDLTRAYWQGFMESESRVKTAFCTPWGLYHWIRIPFGLTNAVPVFQRFMESTLEDYRDEFVIPYLDDTIVHSKSVMEHIGQIRKVLEKFKSKGLKLNPTKCDFFKREVIYLGRKVNQYGYTMDESSTQAVRDLAGRKFETVGEVRQLLGLLSYHRRHVQDFASIAKPLTDLLLNQEPMVKTTRDGKIKKIVPSRNKVEWKEEHQQSLKQLIHFVTNPPVLAYPNFEKEFFIHTDASAKGLGAILYQTDDDGVNRVVAYASRSLKPSERNYHSSKLEFLSMKWAVTEKFRPYLAYADNFKVFTDNNPLLFVMGLNKPNATIQRWISELAEFRFSIHYRPGVINKDADALSRLPLAIDEYQVQCKEKITLNTFEQLVASVQLKEGDVVPIHEDPGPQKVIEYSPYQADIAGLEAGSEDDRVVDIRMDQREDPYIAPVIEILEGERIEDKANLSEMSKLLLKERKRLVVDETDGVLRRECQSVNQIVLPLKHRNLIYKSLHNDLGHLGSERVLQLARSRVYWPRMQKDVEEYTQKRCRCLIQKKTRQQEVAPLVSIHSSTSMELVSIDYLHLEKSSGGYEYIFLIVDHFTRYAQAFPTKNKSALTAAKHLFNDFILKFGLPARLMHDQGREFENRLFREMENFCGIVKARTTPYHPQTNGTCERMNSTLLHMLRTLAESEKPKWHEHVNKLVSAYNATTHSTTGYSPHFLLFGKEPIIPLDLLLTQHARPKRDVGTQYSRFVDDWESRMTDAYKIAKERCDKVKKYAEDAWRKRKIANRLEPGDRVLVRNKRQLGGPGKLRSCWEQDVFVVRKSREDGVVYEIENLSKGNDKRALHRNMLLPCDLLEDPPAEAEQPLKQTTQKPTRTTRQPQVQADEENHLDGDSDSDSTSDGEGCFYPAGHMVMRSQPVSSSGNERTAGMDDTSEAIVQAEPTAEPEEVTTVEGVEDCDEQPVNSEQTVPETMDGQEEANDDQEEPDQPSLENNSTTRRTLRSDGKTLHWNPSMGNSDVILEQPDEEDEGDVTIQDVERGQGEPQQEEHLDPIEDSEHQMVSSGSMVESIPDNNTEDETDRITAETECRRSARSRRPPMVLTYGKMGGNQISIPLSDNTGEVEVITLKEPPRPTPRPRPKPPQLPTQAEPSGIRRLLNLCSDKLCEWLDTME